MVNFEGQFEMNKIPDSVVDEAARLIREEKLLAPAAAGMAYKSHFGYDAESKDVSEICRGLQAKKAAKEQSIADAEDEADIKRRADAYRRASDGE